MYYVYLRNSLHIWDKYKYPPKYNINSKLNCLCFLFGFYYHGGDNINLYFFYHFLIFNLPPLIYISNKMLFKCIDNVVIFSRV